MFKPFVAPEFSLLDRTVFDATVKFDHWVRRAQKHVDFLVLRESIEDLYNLDVGCPGIEPILMIKLELLLDHENLSDARLWKRVETDLADRWFWDSMTIFPTRVRCRAFAAGSGPTGIANCLMLC